MGTIMSGFISLKIKDCHVFKGCLEHKKQQNLMDDIRKIATLAPMFSPLTPWGRPMSVKMTSAGKYGWYSDKSGYQYAKQHPDGLKWPAIPISILCIWQEFCPKSPEPDCCLVNYYTKGAKMGLHQDKDEANFEHPVLSVSLGDDALFRIGGKKRDEPTESIWLSSGDVLVMGGQSRLAYHGIDQIKFGSSQLLKSGGRINLTMRVVD